MPIYLRGDEWIQAMENMLDLKEIELKSDLEMVLDYYHEAFLNLNESELQHSLNELQSHKNRTTQEGSNCTDFRQCMYETIERCRRKGKDNKFLVCLLSSDTLGSAIGSIQHPNSKEDLKYSIHVIHGYLVRSIKRAKKQIPQNGKNLERATLHFGSYVDDSIIDVVKKGNSCNE